MEESSCNSRTVKNGRKGRKNIGKKGMNSKINSSENITCKSSPLVRYLTGEAPKSGRNAASIVKCPVCENDVNKNTINEHLDNNCDQRITRKDWQSCQSTSQPRVKRQNMMNDIIVIDDDDNDGDEKCKMEREEDKHEKEKDLKSCREYEEHFEGLDLVLQNETSKMNNGLLEFRKSLNPFRNELIEKMDENEVAFHCSSADLLTDLSNDDFVSQDYVSQRKSLDLASNFQSKSKNTNEEFTALCSKSNHGLNLSNEDDFHESGNEVTYEPYYWANFKFVISSVCSDANNFHLFNEEDSKCIKKFKSLTEVSQQLYVRLFLRKNVWLKMDRLAYPKIKNDLKPLIFELIQNEYLDDKSSLDDLNEVLDLMSAPEIRSLAQTYQLFKNGNGDKLSKKKDLISGIINLSNNQTSIKSFFTKTPSSESPMKNSIMKRAKALLGDCVKVSRKPRDIFCRCFNLFSLTNYSFNDDDNPNSALIYRILQINKGELVFASYNIIKNLRIFSSRDECIFYTNSVLMEEDFQHSMENKNFDEAVKIYEKIKNEVEKICSNLLIPAKKSEIWSASLPIHLRKFSREWVLLRICSKSVEALEKKNLYNEAVQLLRLLLSQVTYCLRSRGALWDRLAIDTERYLKDQNKALDYIKIALHDPWVRTGMRLNLVHRAHRICNASKNKCLKHRLSEFEAELLQENKEVTISAPVFLDTSSSHRTIFLMNDINASGDQADQSYSVVEEYALGYYKDQGYPNGVHAEGASFSFIFTLLFWDIIFMDVEDVFLGPFQAGPLDLYTDQFYELRQEPADRKLQEIRNSSMEELRVKAKKSWMENEGKVCLGCNWNIFENVEQVMDVLSCLKADTIAGICEIFCKDYRNRCSGMPDLLVWNAASRKCKAVEVKGPGDRLSSKQMVWLNIMTSLGLDAEVCYVKGVGGKKRRISNGP